MIKSAAVVSSSRSAWTGLLLKTLATGSLVLALSGCLPIPIMDITPTAPTAGTSVTFDGSGTIVSNIPEDTTAVSYRWTFGDGATGSGSSTTHTYSAAGTYDITLKVIDSAGRVGETKETLTVGAAVATTTETEDADASTASTSSTSQ